MRFIISQILGAIGYSALAYSYFRKEKREILIVQIIAYIGFTTHYYLLGAQTGTMCNVLGFVALILIYFLSNDKKKKTVLVCILIPLLGVMSYLSFENWFSLFPIFACLVTFISFLFESKNIIRFVGIVSAVCWLIYAIVFHSYTAIVFEVITVIATTVAFLKNRKESEGHITG